LAMSLTTPSKIRDLPIQLYRKAKNDRHQVRSRGTHCFSDEVVFGELGVIRLRDVQLGPRS